MTHTPPTLYRVLAAPGTSGGKRVAVFPEAGAASPAEMQAQAARSGAPLSVFVTGLEPGRVTLRVFTPEREKGESDSGALAALDALFRAGLIPDLTDVLMREAHPAQRCRGEWLLRQGDAQATALDLRPSEVARVLGLSARALAACPVTLADAGRPNLVLALRDHASLDAAAPDLGAISGLNRETGTLGLIAFTAPGRRGERADFRAFGPLKGFAEDNASSNMAASLLASLSLLGLLPQGEGRVTLAQGEATGRPSRLTAQLVAAGAQAREVWVGGAVTALTLQGAP